MRHVLFTAALVALFGTLAGCSDSGSTSAVVAAPDASGWQHFGTATTFVGAIGVADTMALANGAQVVVEGTVERVCQASGCWLDLTDGAQSIRIHFENADGSLFHLPMDGKGGQVVARGVIEVADGERSLVASAAQFRRAPK